jgi:hypothetical protein
MTVFKKTKKQIATELLSLDNMYNDRSKLMNFLYDLAVKNYYAKYKDSLAPKNTVYISKDISKMSGLTYDVFFRSASFGRYFYDGTPHGERFSKYDKWKQLAESLIQTGKYEDFDEDNNLIFRTDTKIFPLVKYKTKYGDNTVMFCYY